MKSYNTKGAALIAGCLCALAGLSSCSEDEIEAWKGYNTAWYCVEKTDFSFVGSDGLSSQESALAGIPFTVAAPVADRDRFLEVDVTREPSDSRTRYELVRPVVLEKGNLSGTMYVRVFNGTHLYSVHDTIEFRIVESADFKPGLPDCVATKLCVFNGVPRPEWWNEECENGDLGMFNDVKLQIYYAVFGNYDDPRKGTPSYRESSNINIYYARTMLNAYVRDNNIRYPEDYTVVGNRAGMAPRFTRRCH